MFCAFHSRYEISGDMNRLKQLSDENRWERARFANMRDAYVGVLYRNEKHLNGVPVSGHPMGDKASLLKQTPEELNLASPSLSDSRFGLMLPQVRRQLFSEESEAKPLVFCPFCGEGVLKSGGLKHHLEVRYPGLPEAMRFGQLATLWREIWISCYQVSAFLYVRVLPCFTKRSPSSPGMFKFTDRARRFPAVVKRRAFLEVA